MAICLIKIFFFLVCYPTPPPHPTKKIKVHGIIILPVALYGCDTWSFTLRDERRLRVLEKSVLRRIFWPNRDEVTGEWRKLHDDELMFSTPHPILLG
jgi:hypothetical protein